jgi:GNAT superfamily N-acetyltransferase
MIDRLNDALGGRYRVEENGAGTNRLPPSIVSRERDRHSPRMRDAHSPRVTYREAGSRDVPAMERCRLGDPSAGTADARMTAYFQGHHHPQKALGPRVGFVAVADASVVGYIAGHLTRRFDTDGELQYLYVAPPVRRRGVARELVKRLAAWFVEQGVRHICVNVDDDSPGARPFYASLGATDLRPHWMHWPDIGLVLERD